MTQSSDSHDYRHSGAHSSRSYREQAEAVRASLESSKLDETKRILLLQGAKNLEIAADRIDNPRKSEEAILKFDIYTHEDVVKKARLLQAVSVGEKVCLPFCTPLERILPLCFARSSLFPATEREELVKNIVPAEVTEGQNLETVDRDVKEGSIYKIEVSSSKEKQITLTLEGGRLYSYDRAIFAACLSKYRDQPLSSGPGSPWIELSFGALANLCGTTRGSSSYAAMKASLNRLANTKLTIGQSLGKSRITLNPMMEVKFKFDDQSRPKKIQFRIGQEVAELFGRQSWWRFPHEVLKMQDLVGWLASFFASHKNPRELPLSYLYRLSGLRCKESDFKTLLTNALEKLKSPKVPSQARVVRYDMWSHSIHGYVVVLVTTATMLKS